MTLWPAPTQADYPATIEALVQATARSRSYNDAASCAGYVASTVPAWRAEAEAFVAWRDGVYLFAFEALAAVQGGAGGTPERRGLHRGVARHGMAPMTRPVLRRPLGLIGISLARVFRDPPSWYEFVSGAAVVAFAMSLLFIAQPLALGRLRAIMPLLPDNWWPVICLLAGLTQVVGVLGVLPGPAGHREAQRRGWTLLRCPRRGWNCIGGGRRGVSRWAATASIRRPLGIADGGGICGPPKRRA